MGKKRSGPSPELISLHPFTVEEVVDVLLTTKPRKKPQKKKPKKSREQEQCVQATP